MAEINVNATAAVTRPMTSMASPTRETSSVSKTPKTKTPPKSQEVKHERVQEDNIERDIVAVSTDGDTVAVSKDGVADAKELKNIDNDKQRDDDKNREDVTYQPQPLEAVEAPELHPIEAPELTQDVTSFAGISDMRMQELLRDDKISQYQYDSEMAARKSERAAAVESAQENQRVAANMRVAMERISEEDIMLENAFEKDGNETFSPKVRSDVITNLQERATTNARREEEEGRLWDYQFLA